MESGVYVIIVKSRYHPQQIPSILSVSTFQNVSLNLVRSWFSFRIGSFGSRRPFSPFYRSFDVNQSLV
jgi:hypothetical protein